jgi:hypothetical protein
MAEFEFNTTKEKPVDLRLLRGWHTLSPELTNINSIAECIFLLKHEIRSKNRYAIVERICARITKIVNDRVKEILNAYIRKIEGRRKEGM